VRCYGLLLLLYFNSPVRSLEKVIIFFNKRYNILFIFFNVSNSITIARELNRLSAARLSLRVTPSGIFQ
jgi:hypothetical protein